jgi:alkanesulfonate monooxygenase SsuD/methylene tetrahydromethanopterin reductase-like flavin-dependent oxidoreductase (luciferase family)
MIGGGGERKTLRLVAKYADATNVFGGPTAIHHKYEVLREHCAAVGRDPDEIERSTLQSVNVASESPAQIVDRFGELADAGAQAVIFSVRNVDDPAVLETLGRDVLPQLRDL